MNNVIFENRIVTPSKVVCVGRNFVAHIEELGNDVPSSMVIFNKPNSSITNKLYFIDEECHYESEISFLVKNSKIIGVGIGLDLTKRKLQSELKSKGLPWERAKSFDNSAVFSEFVSIDDTQNLSMKLYIDEQLIQKATTDLMIYKPNEIIKEIETFMTLENYDIIMTGTPKGVGNYNLNSLFKIQLQKNNKPIIEKKWRVSKAN